MAEGRAAHDWERTSALMALTANCHRDTKRRPAPFTPDEFNPVADRHKKPKAPPPKVPLTVLKGIFCKE